MPQPNHDRSRDPWAEPAPPSKPGNQAGDDGRRSVVDRRSGADRRDEPAPHPAPKNAPTGLERRRGPGRRLSDHQRAAEEGEMTREQFLFLKAIEAFKKANGTSFPTWSDVLEVVRLLGYRKTVASELNLLGAEDWRERPDTPSGVRPDGWERRFTAEERAALEEIVEGEPVQDDAIPGDPDLEDLDLGSLDDMDEAA